MTDRNGSRNTPGSPPTTPGEDEPSFEAALVRLEAIVDRLEEGDLELEAALEAFEQGVALTRRCAGRLEDAERRIEILVREGKKWITSPFEPEADRESGELDESD
jgi:exodeoxyribonuclease VII small subunit